MTGGPSEEHAIASASMDLDRDSDGNGNLILTMTTTATGLDGVALLPELAERPAR